MLRNYDWSVFITLKNIKQSKFPLFEKKWDGERELMRKEHKNGAILRNKSNTRKEGENREIRSIEANGREWSKNEESEDRRINNNNLMFNRQMRSG